MIIDHIGRKVKYFSEPSDFPYLHTLAPEAQKELIDSLPSSESLHCQVAC